MLSKVNKLKLPSSISAILKAERNSVMYENIYNLVKGFKFSVFSLVQRNISDTPICIKSREKVVLSDVLSWHSHPDWTNMVSCSREVTLRNTRVHNVLSRQNPSKHTSLTCLIRSQFSAFWLDNHLIRCCVKVYFYHIFSCRKIFFQ